VFIDLTAYAPGNVRIEVGYMNQFIDVSTRNGMRHVAALNFFADL